LADPTSYDFGLADSVVPESVGKPGERTFKITVLSRRGRAVVWMEKEQLFQVGMSIKQFTAARNAPRKRAPYAQEPSTGRPVDLEFRAGDMSLRHDPATDVFTLTAANFAEGQEAAESERRPEEPVEAQFSFPRSAAEKLADSALEVVAAGRKPCPLCGAPMDRGGHFCVRKNGHNKATGPG
jgi:uncharacterized repeat protein (TIGR03847 family)